MIKNPKTQILHQPLFPWKQIYSRYKRNKKCFTILIYESKYIYLQLNYKYYRLELLIVTLFTRFLCGKRKKTVHQDHTSIKGSDIFRLSCLLELKHTSVLGDIFSAQSAHFLRILNWNLEGSIKGSHITYKNISCYSNTITAKFRGARTEYHFTLSMLL